MGGVGAGKRGGAEPQVLLGGRRWTLIPRRSPERMAGNVSVLCTLPALGSRVCACVFVLVRAAGAGGLIDSLSDWGGTREVAWRGLKRRPQSDLP